MSLSATWGTDAAERRLAFPCDGLIPAPDAELYRGITINAAPEIVFRWLCQLRVAPYSYDWIDNGGRQSPPQLIPGLEQLEVGQDVMTIFSLSSFAPNRHLTLLLKPSERSSRIFGQLAVSYLIVPQTDSSCRLLVKLTVRYPRTLAGKFMSGLLPWGDLLMMRKQLLNLKRHAETDSMP